MIKAIEGDQQQLHFLRRAIIKAFLEADAAPEKGGPIVLVFDDLHWAHDDSLDLLAFLIETLRAPILILCIGRPELVARRDGWSRHGGSRHKVIELTPLGDADAAGVMHDMLAPCGDDEAVEDLVDAACTSSPGGNPALLERMVRIFLDMGVLENADEFSETDIWKIHVDKLANVRLPLTVEDAVHARIAALIARRAERRSSTRPLMGSSLLLGGPARDRSASMLPTPQIWKSKVTRDPGTLRAVTLERAN